MPKIRYQYIVVSKIDTEKIHDKLRQAFSEMSIGETITTKSFFVKHESRLNYKSKEYAKNKISDAFKIAHELKMIQKVDNTSAPESFKMLDTVSFWQSQLRGNRLKNSNVDTNTTKTQYMHHLWKFNKWLQKKTFTINTFQTNGVSFTQKTEKKEFKNVEELIGLLEQPFADQKNIVRIIKHYLLDKSHAKRKASYMTLIKNAIASYFEKNEYPLQIRFNPKMSHSTEIEEQSMSLSDLMEFLTTGKPSITEKTLFLCKFHRGLDVSTLVDRFNYEAWEQITKWFGSEDHNSWNLEKCPVPIALTRIKTDYKHVGFVDRDAIDMLCKYLDYRKTKTGTNMQNGQALFLNKIGKPITRVWVFDRFSKIAKRAGIQKVIAENAKKQYKVDSHELRDLLKSTLIDSGCRIDVADHVIGHKPKDSYEKQAKLYPETLRKEYSKASKRLNIFTKFTSVVNGTDDSDELRLQLKEKLSELDRIKESRLDDEARQYRSERFAIDQQRQIRLLQDTVNELKKETGWVEKRPIEFCCVSCSTVHAETSCPAYNSKLKSI